MPVMLPPLQASRVAIRVSVIRASGRETGRLGLGQRAQPSEPAGIPDLRHRRRQVTMGAGEHPRQAGPDDISADEHQHTRGQILRVASCGPSLLAQPPRRKLHPARPGVIFDAAGQPALLPGVPGKRGKPAQQLGHPAPSPGARGRDRGTNGGDVNRARVSSSVCAVDGHHGSVGRGGKCARNWLFFARAWAFVEFATVSGLRATCLATATVVTRTARTGHSTTAGRSPAPVAERVHHDAGPHAHDGRAHPPRPPPCWASGTPAWLSHGRDPRPTAPTLS